MLTQSKLDWTVRMEKLQTASGIELPEHFGIIRNDTNKVLSVRGKDYHPYQNEQLMDLLFKVSKSTGLELHKGGFFGNGEKIYIHLKSDNLKLGNDTINGYLCGLNSNDGSVSLGFGPSTLTVSCLNSFYGVFKQLTTKVRHTKNMELRVEDVCQKLEVALKDEKEMFNNILKLSETPIDEAIKNQITRLFFKIPKDVALTDEKQISTRTHNQMSKLFIDMNGELQSKGDTLWGGLSGLTKFTTHSLSTVKKEYDQNSKMFDQYGERERQVYNYLTSLV